MQSRTVNDWSSSAPEITNLNASVYGNPQNTNARRLILREGLHEELKKAKAAQEDKFKKCNNLIKEIRNRNKKR
ncbi:hypothetical protein [Methanolapillus millepedarum]|uniref:hypothetical protein n=1 Tax=Methanolapillus millepedarum TaxID=3028296 RepID=UPI0030B8BF09